MKHVTTAELREDAEALIRRVNSENEPLLVSEEHRVLAVIMPVGDQAFQEEMEDAMDRAAALRALEENDGEPIPLEEVKRSLGL